MKYDNTSYTNLHNTKGPDLIEDQIKLAEEIDFKYRSAIGELLFAAITCQPEIMYTVITFGLFA